MERANGEDEEWMCKVKDGRGVEHQFHGVLLGVTYGVKHAYPQVWKRWFDKAKEEKQWKGKMVQLLGPSIEGDDGMVCQVGRAFTYCTEEVLSTTEQEFPCPGRCRQARPGVKFRRCTRWNEKMYYVSRA